MNNKYISNIKFLTISISEFLSESKKLFNIAICTLFCNGKMPSNDDGNFCIGQDIGLIFLLLAHSKLNFWSVIC